MRQEYVLCFVPFLDAKAFYHSHILLIEKEKPEWQKGKLNLPGGKLESGETPEGAAFRELWEETSLQAIDCKIMGKLTGATYVVHVVTCYVGSRDYPVQRETEKPLKLWIDDALSRPNLISNLKLVIPLCLAGVKGWEIEDKHNYYRVSL